MIHGLINIFASILWKLSVQLFEKFCNQLFLHCWHNFFCNFVFANHWKFLFWHIFPMSLFLFPEVGKQQFLDAGGLDKLKEFCTKSIFDDKRWDRLLYRACTGKNSTKYHHSSEIKGLCIKKWPSEMLQNLPYFWNMKTYLFFFHFVLHYFSPNECLV